MRSPIQRVAAAPTITSERMPTWSGSSPAEGGPHHLLARAGRCR